MLLSSLTLAISESDMPMTLIALAGAVILIVVFVLNAVQGIYKTKQREETRREVAAYVAEGTISPNDAERILAAGEQETVNISKDGIHIQA